MKVFSAIWAMKYLTYLIRRIATHVHFEIHKVLNFPKHLFRGLKYLCRIWLTRPTTPYGSINPYGDKKAYVSQSDFYGSIMKLLYDFAQLRASNIYIHAVAFAQPFMVFDCLYVNWIFRNWFGLKSACFQMRGILIMTDFPIRDNQVSESGLVIRHLTVGFLVPVRVNAPVRGSRPRKSYSAQIFQSPEQMLGKFSILYISTLT